MEKLNFENFNDVIRAYRKYFRKIGFKRNVWNLILYFLPQTAHRYHEQFLCYLHLKEFMTPFL